MTAEETSRLIDAAGGNSALAQKLGIDKGVGTLQRISNWRKRGMPPAVMLEHYDTIQMLRRKLARNGSERRQSAR
jgi:hypothetical protein